MIFQQQNFAQIDPFAESMLEATLKSMKTELAGEMGTERGEEFIMKIRQEVSQAILAEGLWADELDKVKGMSLDNLLDLYVDQQSASVENLKVTEVKKEKDSPPVTPIDKVMSSGKPSHKRDNGRFRRASKKTGPQLTDC